MAQKKQNYLQGTVILAAAVALVKLIGAAFKIPLGNLLDGTGFGHFNIAYSVYNVLLVISTAGLPVAVSKMVSEAVAKNQGGDVPRIIRAAKNVFLIVGLIGSVCMFVFAQDIADFMGSSASVFTIKVIAPASFLVAVMSVYRGYYQGLRNMYPTGISQVIEALCKLLFGLAIAWYLLEQGYGQEIAAAGAIAGVTLGTALGAVFLLVRRALDKNRNSDEPVSSTTQRKITTALLTIAIPITISSGVLAITNFIDSAVVIRRLQEGIGYSEAQAVWQYGAYGLAQTLFNFPSAFIVPFAVSIVPAIAAALAVGNRDVASRTTETGIRFVALLSLPAAVGLAVLSAPILNLIFAARAEEAAAAAFPLMILGPVVFFNCMVMMTNAVLQSMGKARISMYTMLMGCVAKLIVNWFLVGNPQFGINGAPVGTLCCYAAILIANLVAIAVHLKPAPNILNMFVRPLFASVLMGGSAWAVNGMLARVMSPRLAVLGAIAVAGVIYLLLIVLTKAITRADLEMVPKGSKIADFLRLK